MNEYERKINLNFRSSSRLKKEILVYYEKQTQHLLSYTKLPPFEHAYITDISNTPKFHLLHFLLEIKINNFLKIKIKIPSEYPFKNPSEILINGHDYKYLLNFGQKYLKLLGYDESECLCCSTLCCKNNWSVHKNITDVLKEIYKNLRNKLRIKDIKMCRYVVGKKFGHYLPIEEFL